MRICILSSLIFLFLRHYCAHTLEKNEEDNLSTTYPSYDPKSTENGRNQPQYYKNTLETNKLDYLTGNSGHIRFEEGSPNTLVAFENVYQKGPQYPNQKYPTPIVGRPGLNPIRLGAQHSGYRGQAGYPGSGNAYAAGYQSYYRPPFQQKTLAQQAISAVTDALTSIALYDDKQCVPRLLCEVSSGRTADSPTLLKVTASLGPLVKLLQTYNVVSSSPLFQFGRAAVLGMTSEGDPAACRSAYPQCPTDPDKLLNYLNNHNGGFFRFFGKHKKQQQNLEQFYQQLTGQYDIKQSKQPPGLLNLPAYGFQRPFTAYYEQKSHDVSDIDNEIASSNIEGRIQNKPIVNNFEDEVNEESSTWIFPNENNGEKSKRKKKSKRIEGGNEMAENKLKFPDEIEPVKVISNVDENRDSVRNQKRIFFPDDNSLFVQTNQQLTSPSNLDEYVFDYEHNFYIKRHKNTSNNGNNNGNNYKIQTLYIVRGNSDPSYPEIINVRPG